MLVATGSRGSRGDYLDLTSVCRVVFYPDDELVHLILKSGGSVSVPYASPLGKVLLDQFVPVELPPAPGQKRPRTEQVLTPRSDADSTTAVGSQSAPMIE